MRAETLKGHLDLLVLAVMEDGPRHGYAVIEELRSRTDDALDIPEGTVYPALHRLELAGLLTSKWDETSDAYDTQRRFDFPEEDEAAIAAIRVAALISWRKFRCKGYARADFRLDATGKPWLLEINPNPGIAPDSGFVAAVHRAGLAIEDVIARLIHFA